MFGTGPADDRGGIWGGEGGGGLDGANRVESDFSHERWETLPREAPDSATLGALCAARDFIEEHSILAAVDVGQHELDLNEWF